MTEEKETSLEISAAVGEKTNGEKATGDLRGGVTAWKMILIAMGIPLMLVGCISCGVLICKSTRSLNVGHDIAAVADIAGVACVTSP